MNAGPVDKHSVPDVSFELDTFELVLLCRGPKLSGYDDATIKRVQGEHLAYLFGLQEEGLLKAAVAIDHHSVHTGIGFYATGTIDEVRRCTEEDPAIRMGTDAYELATLLCPKDALAFPRAGTRAEPGIASADRS